MDTTNHSHYETKSVFKICVHEFPECVKQREAKREIAVYYTKITGLQQDNDKHNDIN